MEIEHLCVFVVYESQPEAGLPGGTEEMDLGEFDDWSDWGKEDRKELREIINKLVKLMHPDAAFWYFGDECPECNGMNNQHEPHCDHYKGGE